MSQTGDKGANLIEARGVSLSYGGESVLRDVDFHIAPGEIVTVIGPNGAGKSTLLKALMGLITPLDGQIATRPGLRIGYVPQRLHIGATLPMTVMRFLGLPRRRSASEANAALRDVGVPQIGAAQMSELSGGQFQRVLLARALLARPQLLVLDEATQGLDQPGTAAFYRLIEKVRKQLGCAVLMVSHDLHVVMSTSDRVVCLNGHVCCQGTPGMVEQAPEYRALFGLGTGGAFALYRHDHAHDHAHDLDHDHPVHRHRPEDEEALP